MKVIPELPNFFINSLLDDRMIEKIFEFNVVKIENRGRTINFWKDRSLINKVFRIWYRIFRLIYVSTIFYFQPFIVIFIYY